MNKLSFFFFLLLSVQLLHGQQVKRVNLDAKNAQQSLKLSEIAEFVKPIALETKNEIIADVLLTSEYIFVISFKTISQYDLSGKFIREIDCGNFITLNLAADTIKKELYVPMGKTLRCYDFSGKLKKTYNLENETISCYYHKGNLWIQSTSVSADYKLADYKISHLNLLTGKETFIPSEIQEKSYFENGGIPFGKGNFSTYNNTLVTSFFNEDNTIYQIREQKVSPIIKGVITPPDKTPSTEIYPGSKGIVGKYLFFNYRFRETIGINYFYLEDMKSGKTYNLEVNSNSGFLTSGIIDDIFHTGYFTIEDKLNKEGYFYFRKFRNEFKDQSIGNIPLQEGDVLFIVKTKQ